MELWRKSARSNFSLKRSEAARSPAALFGPFESQPASASEVSALAPVTRLAPMTRLAPRNFRRSSPSFSAAWRGGSQSLFTAPSRRFGWLGDGGRWRLGRFRRIPGWRLRLRRLAGGMRRWRIARRARRFRRIRHGRLLRRRVDRGPRFRRLHGGCLEGPPPLGGRGAHAGSRT